MATVTIATVTDPIDTLNQTAVTATGTVDASTTTCSVSIVDSAGTIVGPTSATVTGTNWALAATDVTSLLDGTLIYEATATDISAGKAFKAKAANKNTGAVGYITLQQLRDSFHDSSNLDPTLMQNAILGASRSVDAHCGRYFYQSTGTLYFSPNMDNLWQLPIADLATTSGLTVVVEYGLDGTYPESRVFGTDFIAEPINQVVDGIGGWPFTMLRSVNAKIWPPHYADFQRDTVKITATWGWPTVPSAITQATTIVAAWLYKRPEAALGVTALPEIGLMRVRDPDVAVILRTYQKADTLMMA